MDKQLLVPLLVALISLGCTFVLFQVMTSRATAQSNWFGSKFRYGGSLAGFVIVFLLLMSVFFKIEASQRPTTPINISGRWQTTTQLPGNQVRAGRVIIRQSTGDTEFSISMELQSVEDANRIITVTSIMGRVFDRKVVWVYENSDRAEGIAMTEVLDNHPNRMIMRFYDLATFETNQLPTGTVTWLRDATD